ncbi:cytochrome P450 [Xylariaceae sp. FL0016]|nr:cytochrome P450 [Xylariaceae sp. FL0016]
MIQEIVLTILGALVFAHGLEFVFSCLDDPQEPPRVRPAIPIPIIGHILGFFLYGFDYYDLLSNRNPDVEIYTIGILNFKVYITHATRLTNLMQKSKTVSLRPFLRTANKIHGDISDIAHTTFDGDLVEIFSNRTKEALAPGPHMDEQNLRMGEESVHEVSQLLNHEQKEFQLFDWAKRVIVHATGVSLFGSEHPFKDTEIAGAMWTWDEHRPGHIFGVDLLGKGYAARRKVFAAMRKYFDNMPADVSLMVRERQRILLEGGVSNEDSYKIQSTLSNAYFNTIPTLYWTIYEIYSRPSLLETIRDEIRNQALQKMDDTFILDIALLQTRCPILLSAYQETQRVRHAQVAFRMLLGDTMIDQYLLKKGHHLHLPARPIHKDPKIWGSHVNYFDPYRFVPAETGETIARANKILPTSFLPWGAAPWLCPARQFATTEILIIVALLALRVDLEPADGAGWERDPSIEKIKIATLPHPKVGVRLKVSPRNDGLGDWGVVVGKSKARITLASG